MYILFIRVLLNDFWFTCNRGRYKLYCTIFTCFALVQLLKVGIPGIVTNNKHNF